MSDDGVSIDASTGLPGLPSGYFWNVGIGEFNSQPSVRLMKREFETKKRWMREVTVEVAPYEVLAYPFLEGTTVTGWPTKLQLQSDGWMVARSHDNGVYSMTRPLEINEESIKLVAIRVFKEFWNNEQAAAKKREEHKSKLQNEMEIRVKYYGDYPPRSVR